MVQAIVGVTKRVSIGIHDAAWPAYSVGRNREQRVSVLRHRRESMRRVIIICSRLCRGICHGCWLAERVVTSCGGPSQTVGNRRNIPAVVVSDLKGWMNTIVQKVCHLHEVNAVSSVRVCRHVLVSRCHISRVSACQDAAHSVVCESSRMIVLVANRLRLPRGIKVRISNCLPICIRDRGNHALSAYQREIIPCLRPVQRTGFRRAAL